MMWPFRVDIIFRIVVPVIDAISPMTRNGLIGCVDMETAFEQKLCAIVLLLLNEIVVYVCIHLGFVVVLATLLVSHP